MLGNRMDQELSMLTDQELAALYRSGDQAAFQKLSARYFFIIRYKASEFYGSGMEPDDLFQEGLLGLERMNMALAAWTASPMALASSSWP